MLAIEFDNGELLVGIFQGSSKTNRSALYTLKNAESLQEYKNEVSNIKLGDDGWWYPIDRIVKFKNVTEEEIKQMRRDGKLEELGI